MPRWESYAQMPKKVQKKSKPQETSLRIIGGHFRGRRLKYTGDPGVRPMKDRVREALFNLLGPAIKGTYAIDLFGGTGALALEAISRGSVGAHIVERHRPTASVIHENVQTLDLQQRVTLVTANTFHWLRGEPPLPETPWVVFVSPPYCLFVDQKEDMLTIIEGLLSRAPEGSLFAVEATKEFDFDELPLPEHWDVRTYSPAVVGVMAVQRNPVANAE